MAKITIFVPEQDPIKLSLDDSEQITVGRAPDNDIVIDHASISGTHAVFDLVDGRYNLSDLESTNGTFVEGAAIGADAPLANGMKIVFGTVEADYESVEEADAAPQDADTEQADDSTDEVGDYAGPSPMGAIAEISARPADFKDLSPIEKVVKKDTTGQIAMIVGAIAIISALGLVAATALMKGS